MTRDEILCAVRAAYNASFHVQPAFRDTPLTLVAVTVTPTRGLSFDAAARQIFVERPTDYRHW